MRKILLTLLAMLLTFPLGAVLKERDLARTLGVLRAELEMSYLQQERGMQRFVTLQEKHLARLVYYMQLSEYISLFLYSHRNYYSFVLSFAC